MFAYFRSLTSNTCSNQTNAGVVMLSLSMKLIFYLLALFSTGCFSPVSAIKVSQGYITSALKYNSPGFEFNGVFKDVESHKWFKSEDCLVRDGIQDVEGHIILIPEECYFPLEAMRQWTEAKAMGIVFRSNCRSYPGLLPLRLDSFRKSENVKSESDLIPSVVVTCTTFDEIVEMCDNDDDDKISIILEADTNIQLWMRDTIIWTLIMQVGVAIFSIYLVISIGWKLIFYIIDEKRVTGLHHIALIAELICNLVRFIYSFDPFYTNGTYSFEVSSTLLGFMIGLSFGCLVMLGHHWDKLVNNTIGKYKVKRSVFVGVGFLSIPTAIVIVFPFIDDIQLSTMLISLHAFLFMVAAIVYSVKFLFISRNFQQLDIERQRGREFIRLLRRSSTITVIIFGVRMCEFMVVFSAGNCNPFISLINGSLLLYLGLARSKTHSQALSSRKWDNHKRKFFRYIGVLCFCFCRPCPNNVCPSFCPRLNSEGSFVRDSTSRYSDERRRRDQAREQQQQQQHLQQQLQQQQINNNGGGVGGNVVMVQGHGVTPQPQRPSQQVFQPQRVFPVVGDAATTGELVGSKGSMNYGTAPNANRHVLLSSENNDVGPSGMADRMLHDDGRSDFMMRTEFEGENLGDGMMYGNRIDMLAKTSEVFNVNPALFDRTCEQRVDRYSSIPIQNSDDDHLSSRSELKSLETEHFGLSSTNMLLSSSPNPASAKVTLRNRGDNVTEVKVRAASERQLAPAAISHMSMYGTGGNSIPANISSVNLNCGSSIIPSAFETDASHNSRHDEPPSFIPQWNRNNSINNINHGNSSSISHSKSDDHVSGAIHNGVMRHDVIPIAEESSSNPNSNTNSRSNSSNCNNENNNEPLIQEAATGSRKPLRDSSSGTSSRGPFKLPKLSSHSSLVSGSNPTSTNGLSSLEKSFAMSSNPSSENNFPLSPQQKLV